MKITLSDECDIYSYLGSWGMERFNVRINGQDAKIDEVDHEGLWFWNFVEGWDEDDYDACHSEFIEWERIEELYVY